MCTYPISAASWNTLARVTGLMPGWFVKQRETVALEIFKRSAMSCWLAAETDGFLLLMAEHSKNRTPFQAPISQSDLIRAFYCK
jgi:hypothetical protein